jgi:uncharacterized protein (DUF1501 family)
MPLRFTRRSLVETSALLVAGGFTAPAFLVRAAEATAPANAAVPGGKRALVVVQLGGGNDGLNTIVPYADRTYYQARPRLAIPEREVLPVSEYVGFHPALEPLLPVYAEGQLAIVQGVGYPNPNRSHFRSMEIWHTAVPEEVVRTGWLGRYLHNTCCGEDRSAALQALNLGDSLPAAFWTEHVPVPSIANLNAFAIETDRKYQNERQLRLDILREIYEGMASRRVYSEFLKEAGRNMMLLAQEIQKVAQSAPATSVKYPNTPFAQGLQTIARLLSADLGTRVFYIATGGFDTHANQLATHSRLLRNVAEGLQAFLNDLGERGRGDDVVVLVFSEFGRRVRENGSAGTDHGAAAPMFLLGGKIKGGLHGAHPSLIELIDGDLRFTVDFRSVYAAVLQDWLGTDPLKVLPKAPPPIELFK